MEIYSKNKEGASTVLRLTIQEAASLLNAYGVECHWHEVKKWVMEGRIKSIQEYRVYRIDEK